MGTETAPKRGGNPAWRKGMSSPNPGGRPKAVRELLELARSHVPASFDLAVKLRDDKQQDARVRLDAAKFIAAYGLGSPPRVPDFDAPPEPKSPDKRLSIEELQEIARVGYRQRCDMRPADDDDEQLHDQPNGGTDAECE